MLKDWTRFYKLFKKTTMSHRDTLWTNNVKPLFGENNAAEVPVI